MSELPKNFVIRCMRCRWSKLTSGVSQDLQDIVEIKSNCKTCGKKRKFICPKCGDRRTFMIRIKGNNQQGG